MSAGAWRIAYAQAAGTSHARTGAPCQDAAHCEVVRAGDGGEVLLASVADGAGSASRSEQGARLVVESFHRAFAGPAQAEPGLDFLSEARVLAWLGDVQGAIGHMAAEAGEEPGAYACTFLGAVVGPADAVFVQIGDGAIVVDAEDGHDWVFWPQHGEYANSTFFVTMAEAATLLQIARRPVVVRELALFSDGLERLVLDMTARTVHSPSLRPIFRWLEQTPDAVDGPSDVLAAYLNSANVNRRTDDDKSLVMAVRVPPCTA